MNMNMINQKVLVPPIKIQGIKTKIVPLIMQNALINDDTLWVEPFMGSGVVGFNIAPKNAIFADSNPHIISFYNAIKSGDITAGIARRFLESEGKLLSEQDDKYYYIVRERFNKEHSPLDFLFLNRSCFNGMIRFNRNCRFNVPYGHKPQRFTKAYVTKIVHQIEHVENLIKHNNWTFLCQSFEETISMADNNSFIYCDPPYIGRSVDYYDSWDEESERKLYHALTASNQKFMLSTWDHNSYRENEYIEKIWKFCYKTIKEHYYFIGAKETNRNSVVEALLTNYEPFSDETAVAYNEQLSFV